MKKTTLIRVFSFLLLLGMLASCQKEKPANPGDDNGNNGGGNPPPSASYYVKMKLDGTPQNFTSTVKATKNEEDDAYILQIQAAKSSTSADEVHLFIFSANRIATGEFTEGEHDTYFIMGAYAPHDRSDDMGIYYGGVHLNDAVPFQIKITEATDTYIKGTFSGTFYDFEGEGTNKKVFTEGEFKAPVQ